MLQIVFLTILIEFIYSTHIKAKCSYFNRYRATCLQTKDCYYCCTNYKCFNSTEIMNKDIYKYSGQSKQVTKTDLICPLSAIITSSNEQCSSRCYSNQLSENIANLVVQRAIHRSYLQDFYTLIQTELDMLSISIPIKLSNISSSLINHGYELLQLNNLTKITCNTCMQRIWCLWCNSNIQNESTLYKGCDWAGNVNCPSGLISKCTKPRLLHIFIRYFIKFTTFCILILLLLIPILKLIFTLIISYRRQLFYSRVHSVPQDPVSNERNSIFDESLYIDDSASNTVSNANESPGGKNTSNLLFSIELCQLCYLEEAMVLYLPCGHTYCCETCSNLLKPEKQSSNQAKYNYFIPCPFCRCKIESMVSLRSITKAKEKEWN